jgi:hypothetical protein
VDEDLLLPVDDALQRLLPLANGVNRRSSYNVVLSDLAVSTAALEIPREIALGRSASPTRGDDARRSAVEDRILKTLDDLVPSAGLSYRQALADLADPSRVSHRGTANELRNVLWDVLDRLAPDADVIAAPGFKLEKDRDNPTHRQKARYVFKKRLGNTSRDAAETAVDLIEVQVGTLARAVYSRSSVSAHVATTAAEVRQVKMYLDTVLAELLEIHAQ